MIQATRTISRWLFFGQGGRASLLSAEQMRRILERERLRADRSRSCFSLLTLTFHSGNKRTNPPAAELARLFRDRLRATDDAGWLSAGRIGIVLPETPGSGAWKLCEDICDRLPSTVQKPQCEVFVYPTDDSQPLTDRHVRSDSDEPSSDTRPLHAMFAQPLPAWKRVIDIVGASMALIVASLFMPLIVALIKWQSPGPAFYQHERIGRHGRRFKVWKLRTMVCDADRVLNEYLDACPNRREEWNRDHKLRDDPRITKLGRFLRKSSIDELPQLWNILKGDMSLVGPRPIVAAEISKYGYKFEPYCRVLPGLTGLWQISGRNDTTYAQRVDLDSYYARNSSLALDLYILLMTVRVVLFRQGAY
jgi:lipopolysaccharide/colanic/teichoic acid biosynthesis glycosyltransferase